jgi:hypothetical protein
MKQDEGPTPVDVSSWCLILGWWLLTPLSLFAFSWLTGTSVFVDRYLSISLPGAALVACAAAGRFIGGRQWMMISAGFGWVLLLFFIPYRGLTTHSNSDWRKAAQAINHWDAGRRLPVVTPSPFIEARSPAWQPSYPLPGFLYAHLHVYPITGQAILLPHEISPEGAQFTRQARQRILLPSRSFVIYGSSAEVHLWAPWFQSGAGLGSWRQQRLGEFGDVEAVLFEAP